MRFLVRTSLLRNCVVCRPDEACPERSRMAQFKCAIGVAVLRLMEPRPCGGIRRSTAYSALGPRRHRRNLDNPPVHRFESRQYAASASSLRIMADCRLRSESALRVEQSLGRTGYVIPSETFCTVPGSAAWHKTLAAGFQTPPRIGIRQLPLTADR